MKDRTNWYIALVLVAAVGGLFAYTTWNEKQSAAGSFGEMVLEGIGGEYDLEVTDVEWSRSGYVTTVTGSVKNTSGMALETVQVNVTFYGDNGNSTARGFLRDDPLEANQTSVFTVSTSMSTNKHSADMEFKETYSGEVLSHRER